MTVSVPALGSRVALASARVRRAATILPVGRLVERLSRIVAGGQLGPLEEREVSRRTGGRA